MARYVAGGADVVLVTCTLGEHGEIIPAELAALGASAGDQLGGYRAGELDAALGALGKCEHRYLGGIGRWRDSGMSGTSAAEHPRAFANGPRDEQVRQLRAILDEFRPQVVVSYDENGGYGHPDHIRAHEITMAATEHAGRVRRVFHTAMPAGALARGVAALPDNGAMDFRRPADGELPSVPDERVSTTIDITEQRAAKIAALRAHRSQISVPPLPAQPRHYALSNGVAQPILDAEHFVLARGPSAGATSDLFGGLG